MENVTQITLCNRLETENIHCCSFAHSWCIQDLSCSTVHGRRCLILLFMMHHTFSIENVNCFQLVTVQLSIILPRVSHTCKVDSPALPVFSSIKPHCAQSRLLDRTGVFSQSFKRLSTVLVFPSLVIVSSCLSVYLFSNSPSTLPFNVYIDSFDADPRLF